MNIRPGKPGAGARGQSALELAVLVTGIIAAAVGLSLYLRNTAAARIKAGADALSPFLADPQQVEIASIRCQDFIDQQTSAPGARGATRTTYAEASEERIGDLAVMTPLSDCPQLPVRP